MAHRATEPNSGGPAAGDRLPDGTATTTVTDTAPLLPSTAAATAHISPARSPSPSTSTLGPASSSAPSIFRSRSPSPSRHNNGALSATSLLLHLRRRGSKHSGRRLGGPIVGSWVPNLSGLSRAISFVAAIVSALCAGSVTVYSLYAPVFQERLRYSQIQVNGVSIAASVALYLPVPLLGFLCDRVGPGPLSALAAVLFGGGYGLAAGVYKKAERAVAQGGGITSVNGRVGVLEWLVDCLVSSLSQRTGNESDQGARVGVLGSKDTEWTYPLMVFAFACIGVGTCAMYMASVATCAKNFGRGRFRGLALAMPIAAFGLSGMWLSQLGSRVFYVPLPGGGGIQGPLDVYRFFVFLAVLLTCVGFVDTFVLQIVDEQELIDEAVEELERSGFLDGSALFSPTGAPSAGQARPTDRSGGYGTMSQPHDAIASEGHRDDEDDGDMSSLSDDEARNLLDPAKDLEADESSAAKWRKALLLNAETRAFLSDHTMWFLTLGFFLMVGPGEAFINNLGTIIPTLYPPPTSAVGGGSAAAVAPTSPATHVSIVGLTSTAARLITGSLTDLLAPTPQARHVQVTTPASSMHRGQLHHNVLQPRRRFALSRVVFLLAFGIVLSAGLVFLAAGFVQGHGERFWVSSACVGAGYGAVFSLTPIIITVIWGVENFATNWGIVAMFPALGSSVWGLLYSAVYQAGAHQGPGNHDGSDGKDDEIFCYGSRCYAPVFWAMTASVWVACGLIVWAWKGRNGWVQRGVVV